MRLVSRSNWEPRPAEPGPARARGGARRGSPRRPDWLVADVRTVIGQDERTRIWATALAPWRHICQLDLEGPIGTFKGTGWLVGPRTVVTAGHCVHYPPFFEGWASRIVVSPGRDADTRPFGQAVATRFSSVDRWIDHRDADFDLGCIHLDEPIGNEVGWLRCAVLPDDELRSAVLNHAGYPVDRGGEELYFHANAALACTERRVFYAIDSETGQSGGPVWVMIDGEPVVVALHAYGTPGTPHDDGDRGELGAADRRRGLRADRSLDRRRRGEGRGGGHGLGDGGGPAVRLVVPEPVAHHVLDHVGGPAHVGVVEIERGEAEAHDVGRAEVADDAAGDQRLHRGVALAEAERDLAAAPLQGRAGSRASGRGSAPRPRR